MSQLGKLQGSQLVRMVAAAGGVENENDIYHGKCEECLLKGFVRLPVRLPFEILLRPGTGHRPWDLLSPPCCAIKSGCRYLTRGVE